MNKYNVNGYNMALLRGKKAIQYWHGCNKTFSFPCGKSVNWYKLSGEY